MTEGLQPLHPDPTSRYAGERSSAPPSRSAVFLFTIVGIAFMLSALTASYYGHRAPERTSGSTSTASKTPPAVSSTPLPHDCKQCPEMLKIQSGEFLMGSPPDEEGSPANERPQHRVAIREFAIGKYEVTRGEYAHFVDKQKYEASEDGCYVYPVGKPETKDTSKTWRTPGFEQSDRDPVVCVSWKDAKAYVDWLSRETQEPYRLLTEAEWEYVARAGVETPYPSGANTSCGDGNFQNCVGKTTPVDRYPPNRWRIYGMLGNAWEWVEDDWHQHFEGAPADGSAWNGDAQDLGVWRGGSWGSEAKDVLLTTRRPQHRDHPSYKAGFRVAKTL